VFGKIIADLNKKYVPCQISTFIILPTFKERKTAIWLSCSLGVTLDQSGTKLRYFSNMWHIYSMRIHKSHRAVSETMHERTQQAKVVAKF